MVDFKDHGKVVDLLTAAQGDDSDMRENARECNIALTKRDGQWEPSVIMKMDGRPRYTFDKLNPIVSAIYGQIAKNDYDIMVKPSGGGATKENAAIYDGVIRHIENLSDAASVYKMAGKKMIATGLAGWRIVQEYADADCFDQDLKVKPLSNFEDRVWFGPHELPTAEDAKYCFVLTPVPVPDYEIQFPEGSKTSLPQDFDHVWWNKADTIVVGEFFRKVPVTKVLVKMSDGSVYEDNEDFKAVADELKEQGITEEARRNRKSFKVTVRKFDGGGWLGPEKDTVFTHLPIIPVYANFQIAENKPIYWGAVDKLLDQQRVYNYARSRQIEEGALSPRDKTWMTKEQAAGHGNQLKRMNTSADPVQFYNHVDGHTPPYKGGGPQVNPSLEVSAQAASEDINNSAGVFGANLGDNPGLQSGAAIGMQMERGDDSNFEYVEALSRAIRHTAKVLVAAIPRVYTPGRQTRIMSADGTFEVITVGEMVLDRQSGRMVTLNDLSQGVYDVVCEANKSMRSRQEHTARSLMELGAIDPSIIDMAGDVLLRNIPAPGMDDIAARKRAMLLDAGVIPEDQMTDEEKAIMQAKAEAAKNAPKDPASLIAEAEVANAQARAAETQSKSMERAFNAQMRQQELAMKLQDQEVNQELAAYRAQMEFNQQIAQNMKTMAETLNAIREAIGADAVITQQGAGAYENQAGMLEDMTDAAADYIGDSMPNQ